IRTASCSSDAGITLSTGPKISSCAIVDALSTLPNTVGSMNQPRSRCAGRFPPAASVAPSATPFAMYPSTRSRDDDAGERRADLTGHHALGLGERRRGRRDIGVVEDHGGRLAAEFERD